MEKDDSDATTTDLSTPEQPMFTKKAFDPRFIDAMKQHKMFSQRVEGLIAANNAVAASAAAVKPKGCCGTPIPKNVVLLGVALMLTGVLIYKLFLHSGGSGSNLLTPGMDDGASGSGPE